MTENQLTNGYSTFTKIIGEDICIIYKVMRCKFCSSDFRISKTQYKVNHSEEKLKDLGLTEAAALVNTTCFCGVTGEEN